MLAQHCKPLCLLHGQPATIAAVGIEAFQGFSAHRDSIRTVIFLQICPSDTHVFLP